ncbi:MAG TPA: IPT/TIG domain-containing protein, partial [Thermoanaerobaculia bacterium]|nr:IPT/TIG domain-containing protein [Thermoanaerobaculia bacterium]
MSAVNAALIALAFVVVPIHSAPATPSRTDAPSHTVESVGKLPVIFERNDGQFPSNFDYASRAEGQLVYVHSRGARMFVGGDEAPAELGLTFAGARRDAKKAGGDVATLTNYILGNDSAKWRTGVPSYHSVRYSGVYRGIDVEYHARRGTLEYDFVVAPGADWRAIALEFDGAKPVLDAKSGDLVLRVGKSEIRHRAPYAYQEIGGETKKVESRYAVKNGKVSFVVGAFDRSQPLIIDPVLDFSRVIHPLTGLFPSDIILAPNGDMIVAGTVWGPAGATLSGAPMAWDSRDAMVTRLDGSGNVLFTTFVGGTRHDFAIAVALDADGHIHFVSETGSGDFPTTPGVIGEHTARLSSIYGETRAAVMKFSGANGSILFSTYLEDRRIGSAGNTFPTDIVVDSFRRPIVSGFTFSNKFPVTPDSYDPSRIGGGFIAKLSPNATSVEYATYLMGGDPAALTIDSDDNLYIGGASPSGGSNFATPGAYKTTWIKGHDSFIAKLDEDGNRIFQTFFPGEILDIAIDSSRNVIAAGYSEFNSTPSVPTDPVVPTTPTAYQRTKNGSNEDAYIAKLSASGTTLLAATFFGGTEDEAIDNVRIGPDDVIYVTGASASGNLPMVSPIQNTHWDSQTPGVRSSFANDFIARFNSSLENLLFSTYFGPGIISGFALEPGGNVVFTAGGGGPATWMKGPQDPWAIVEGDAIVARLNLGAPLPSFAVDEVSPAAAPANTGGNLEIRGHGFVPDQMRVFFGDTEATGRIVVFAGGTRLFVPIPAHALGVVDIRVQHPNGTSITRLAEFEFFAPMPTRTVLTPETISSLGGSITITGEHITAGTQIAYRGVGTAPLGQPPYLGGFSLGRGHVTTPPTSVSFQMGPLKRYLKIGEFRMLPRPGVFSTAIYSFPISPAVQPSITEVRPAGGPTTGGTELTISGFGFHPQARVLVGSVFAKQVTFLNSNALTAIVPPNTGGPATVQVMNPDDGFGSLVNSFTYRGISSVTPASGSITGGTSVTIGGYGFSAGPASVTFGGVAATSITVVNDTTITAVTPAHVAGFVDVVVTIGPSTYTAANAYRFLDPPPTISNVTPAQGPDTGGTVVTLTGTGFQSGANVFFGGIAASNVSFVSATQLTATTAPGLAGLVAVSVKNPDDQAGSLPNAFTYRGIASFTPSQAQPGSNITINGAGFETGATVTFSGTAATATVNSSTSITATVPARDPGIVTVVVTNPSSESFSKGGIFRVLAPPPTVTGFTPSNGLPGDPVTITGTNFDMVTGVKIANVSASFVVDSFTQITATVPLTQAATGPITVETLSGTANSAANFTIDNAAAEITSF